MVLNALEVDPGRKWKQNWRWYDESAFDNCVDLEEIKKDGIIWRQWCNLARCHGLSLKPTLAVNSSVEEFRQLVRKTTASDERVLVLNYNRAVVGQVGDGHYSPIGAYLADEDMCLVFDVARFKHPPHWLPLTLLWEAMLRKDPVTGFARGFAPPDPPSAAGRDSAAVSGDAAAVACAVAGAESAEEELWLAMRSMPAAAAALAAVREDVDVAADDATRRHFHRSRAELARTNCHRALTRANASFRKRDGPLPVSVDACAVLALVLRAIVPEERMRTLMPRAAPLLLDEEEPLLASGSGSAIAEDIVCSRGVLAAEMGRSGAGDAPSCCDGSPPALRQKKPCASSDHVHRG